MTFINSILQNTPGLNTLLLNINFYAEDENAGGSIIPFFGFLVFLAGVMIVFIAAINLLTIWRDFKSFYDDAAGTQVTDKEEKKKKMIKQGVLIGVGVVMIVISHFMNYMV